MFTDLGNNTLCILKRVKYSQTSYTIDISITFQYTNIRETIDKTNTLVYNELKLLCQWHGLRKSKEAINGRLGKLDQSYRWF